MSMSEYPTKGKFCRKLREVTAVRVAADNEEQLQQLVLGGKMTPPTDDCRACFMFVARTMGRSRTKVANEGDWIVTEDGFNFEVYPDEHFRAEFEPK